VTTTYNPGRQLPTVPGMVPGVVKFEKLPETVSYKAEFQCADCHIVEAPQVPVATTVVFHTMAGDGKRRCTPCRIKQRETEYPDCKCHLCEADAT